jgi:uncharacterized protein
LQSFSEKLKALAKYTITIQGLEDSSFDYEFEGNDAFFQAFEQELIQKGNFVAKVKLDKSATMLRLAFDISGTVELICDRSLDTFEEPFSTTEKYIYKFGDRFEEITEELSVIPFGTSTINIAQQIYEFIAITIPMKKLHPRFRNEDDDAEEILVYSTDNQQVAEKKEIENIDPRWAALNKLKEI